MGRVKIVGTLLPILYEDNHVLVVDKRAGLLSQADLSGDLDVLTVVKEFLKRRDEKPGNVYLGLVHRLDRPVSGAMILAKTSKAASRLSAALRARDVYKVYRAIVHGAPEPAEGELRHRLLKDQAARVTRVCGEGEGREARLAYRLLEARGDTSLVEVDLLTGLPHQIRVQLAAIGCPIVGDRKYGSPVALPDGRIWLHAFRVTFPHPVTREAVAIEAPLPPGWPEGLEGRSKGR
ncbi:MAG: RluA family pseudouridine synthase [Deltaproteobacteria bacterium]|nr:RluA family pseudouridine synthase [Deltaproteobacteria bacterium]